MTIDEAAVRQAIADAVGGERLQVVRVTGTSATAVIDAGGLDSAARAALEQVAKAAGLAAGLDELRVALTAEKRSRRILAVGSGKGGVGKSTLSANLAVALARLGRKVGLVDADIYGPSQPRLLGTEGRKPEARDKTMIPIPSPWGVPMLSMGHLVQPGQAIAWRGPMAGSALGQLIEADWGDTEILVVDLPPGTGDIQLTMLQKYKPAGAVIVSTPQDLALIDATRAIGLFDQGKVPVLGLVENMAGYLCPHCGQVSDPFGHGGAEVTARELGLPFLGRVPLDIAIRQKSDAGEPPAAGEGPQAQAFMGLARAVLAALDQTA
ncbi:MULTISPECIES: Mrp/NBP35 family ATP-binding protein [unclassified Novosphingobium]|uniref:Mrp/NBP35 family ATP-binding protein n=2 Tax=Novosphingobium TaxID=165696 RepID=UPI001442559E|nr:ATP-binding protein involved in chromosome partitioning [Novosphingobium sp. BK256]MBB3376282.1 ATP-binding protein involved in chromosome partitioning [Novosphingobium sp. BK280]MBB3380696.1 ATP-binding protein involved in chromosome partitioning [Novosphingobium sp. BK258]MBB3422308.1 ATP-binding protein involved in chromosome partitioning [Novosphingobium sp. BK267]MBB3451008.1 ATP-binding protein involved in chromosome partitioning [Novosphingobium sp. BK352]MBB3479516.1 ATP-binding pro